MEKERFITVKGIGKLTVPVDYVVIGFTFEELNKDYKKGYELFENHIIEVQNIIQGCGFNKKDLQTSELKERTEYEHVNKKGVYTDVFKGYKFSTEMLLRFDFSSEKLNEIFSSITKSKAAPKIKVNFTVKDEEAVKKSLLGNAAKDAKEKADILCQSLGVKLGSLLRITYNWDEIEIHSTTFYDINDDGMYSNSSPVFVTGGIDFTPDDISVEDDASFIWEITD